MTCKGDGYLQLAPLLSEAWALGLEARILSSKLLPFSAHRICRPLEELLTKGGAFASAPQYVFYVALYH